MSKVEVVCVTYRHGPKLETFLNCMLSQTSQSFRLTVIHDGPDAEFDRVADSYGKRHPELMRFIATTERFNDYGHSLRELGLKLAEHNWVLLTNGDNYYCPVFIETMLHVGIDLNCDLVMCDMLHSHPNPGGRPQKPYKYFPTAPWRGAVDIGCFIVRTKLAKRVGFRDKSHDGDATYVEDLINAHGGLRVSNIDQALLVHN